MTSRSRAWLTARHDVLTFTGPQLPGPLDVIGAPIVELAHRSDNPRTDVFVRVSEVDAKGRSRNVTDGFTRLTAADGGDHVAFNWTRPPTDSPPAAASG